MHETEFTSRWRQLSGGSYGDGGTEGAADETLDAKEDALKTREVGLVEARDVHVGYGTRRRGNLTQNYRVNCA